MLELSKNQIGEIIKKARKVKSKELGKRYTQVMLAKDIGMSQGYIGDIESGRTYPTLKVLNKIATACNLPMSFFSYEIDTDKIRDSECNLCGSSDSIQIEHILPNFICNNPENNNYFDTFKNYILMTKKIHDSLPDLCFLDPKTNKRINIEVKSTPPIQSSEHISSNTAQADYSDNGKKGNSYNIELLTVSDNSDNRNKAVDINDILSELSSNKNLCLNGYPISKDAKVALLNSFKLGIEFAAQLQNKELELLKLINDTSTLIP